MSLTSRDIEEIREREPFKRLSAFIRFLFPLIRPLVKVPLIYRYLSETPAGLWGSIFNCWKKQEYEKATQIAIYALEKYRNRGGDIDDYDWWTFMTLGVDSAKHIESEDLREKLIEYANTGIEPFEGYNVAYSYLEFSRWKYSAKNYEEAVRYAEVASRADHTWAEPDFILGWYGLVLSTGNAEEHLSRAVEKDERVLFRIANNSICKQYPHVVNKLKAKYSGRETKSGPNNTINLDS